MRRRFIKSQTSLSYMTIEAVEYTTVELPADIEYSFNDGNTWEEGHFGVILYLQPGVSISFRNMNRDLNSITVRSFGISGSCNLTGNCMSLIPDGKLYTGAFKKLFQDCAGIMYVSEDFLPATTLAAGCYTSMFSGCTNLTSAPKLPATTLASRCYYCMFDGTNVLPDCSNIDFTSNAVVSSGGLIGLFAGTKITDNDLYNILPINPTTGKYWLPATTLTSYCYEDMFNGCRRLTTAPELPATTLAEYCYSDMFHGCASLTKAPELPATTLAGHCYSGMFFNCASLTKAPELPATTLAGHCYSGMFRFCSKLNYIKAMFTTTPSVTYTKNWVYGAATSGTFVKNKKASWNVVGANGIPSGWTIKTE